MALKGDGQGAPALNTRQQQAAVALQQTVRVPPARRSPPERAVEPAMGRADRTLLARARKQGDTRPQGDMTPAEWNAKHPNATYEDQTNYRMEFERDEAVNARYQAAHPDHIGTQTQVGGTSGHEKVVDRSAAVKKSWETRKKLYGPSGFKAK